MVPAVGTSCSRISFDVVVLPQPDSPISPKVSPGKIAKSTPSTALTQPILRRNRLPVLTGKYFCRSLSSSSGADIGLLRRLLITEPAPRSPLDVDQPFHRLLFDTARHRMRASRVKGAARRQPCQIGWLSGDREQRLLAAELWHRAEQGLG